MVMDMVMAMDTDTEDMATTTARGLLLLKLLLLQRLLLLLRPLLLLSPDTTAMDMVMVMAMDTDMEDTVITTARGLLSPDTMAMDMVMVMAMDMVTDMVMATTDKMVFNCSRVQC